MNPAKPPELKKAQGTLRADRMPANPIVPRKSVRFPRTPKKYPPGSYGRKKWKVVCTLLMNENRLMEADHDIIELLVDSWVHYNDAQEQVVLLKKSKEFVKIQTNKTGGDYEVLTAWWKIAKETKEEIRKLSADLGLTPASRTKVGLPVGNKDKNGAEALRANLLSGSYGGPN